MFNWESNVRRVEPYVPGEQPKEDNIIKLNTNENPYPPSPNVKMDDVDISLFRKYPDPTAGMLVKTIAEYHTVNEDQVFVGVGSDDVLAMSFMTFFNSEKPILFPDITYSFYPVWAEEFRIPYKAVPLNDDFRIVKEDYYTENGGIVFPNPNAPTGIEESLSFVRDILDHNRDSVVIVDEAYIDKEFDNVTALYRLDQKADTGSRDEEDLGPLPATAKALLGVLVLTWIMILLYVGREQLKKRAQN